MAFEIREGQIFVFRNEDHDPERNNPTHRGSMMVNGEEYWVSLWVKEGQKGKFFAGQVQPKENRFETPSRQVPVGEFDDDIPF